MCVYIYHDISTVFYVQGSWRLQLRSSFKNFRRDYPRNDATDKQSSKKRRVGHTPDDAVDVEAAADENADEEYEEAIKDMQAEYAKGKKGGRNHSLIKELMEKKTHATRQKWIQLNNPAIADVIDLFPALSTTKGVSHAVYVL